MRLGTAKRSLRLFSIIAAGTSLYGLLQGYEIGETLIAAVILSAFQHHDAHALGTPLLMGALILHGNISAISGNGSAISRVCGGMRSLG